jgi:hypothetical protein
VDLREPGPDVVLVNKGQRRGLDQLEVSKISGPLLQGGQLDTEGSVRVVYWLRPRTR